MALYDGTVVNVRRTAYGTFLTAAAASGASVLSVEDAGYFNEDGGTLLLDDAEYAYTAVDMDEDVVTLAAPLPSGYAEEAEALVYPLVFELVADVVIEDDDEAMTCRIPHSLHDKLTEGLREPWMQESVVVGEEAGELVVRDILGSEPLVDGSFINPDSEIPVEALPPLEPAPPEAPTLNPVPELTGGVGALFLRLPAVANPDAAVVDVWVGSSIDHPTGSIPLDATTYHGEASGTMYLIETLPPDGTPLRDLPQDTTYYVVVRTRNESGTAPSPSAEVSAQTRPVDAEDFAVGYLYAGEINVAQLTGGTFELAEGTVSTIEAVDPTTQAKVGLSGSTAEGQLGGFYAIGAPEASGDQPVLVHFPINGAPNIVSGTLEASTLKTASATLGGTTEVAPGSSLVLGGQVTAPKAQPSVVSDWHTVQQTGGVFGSGGISYAGLTKGHDGNWWTIRSRAGSSSVIEKYTDTGSKSGASVGLDADYAAWGGIVYASHHGGRYYLLVQHQTTGVWYVEARGTDHVLIKRTAANDGTGMVPNFNTGGGPAIGWDHVNGRLLMAYYFISGQSTLQIFGRNVDAAGTLTLGANAIIPDTYSYNYDLGYIARVNTESGDRYVFRRIGMGPDTNNFQVFTASGTPTQQVSEQWPNADSAYTSGAWYDGSRFWSLAGGSGKRYRYERDRAMWTSGSAVREVQVSWYDSLAAGTGTHETKPSPKASVTMAKRSRLKVTFGTIPTGAGDNDSPNAARIYVGVGTGVANGSMNLEKTVAHPGTTWSMDSTVAQESPTTHPRTTEGFASGSPAELRTTTGGVSILANGNGSVGTGTFRDSIREAVTPARALVSRSSNDSLTNAAFNLVPFNVEDADPNGMHAAGVFTVPAGLGGTYLIIANARFAASGSGGRRMLRLTKNDTTGAANIIGHNTEQPVASGGAPTYVGVTTEIRLVAGDTVRLFAWQDSGGALNLEATEGLPMMSMRWVAT